MKFGMMKFFRRSKDKKAKVSAPLFNPNGDPRFEQSHHGYDNNANYYGVSKSNSNGGYSHGITRGGRRVPWHDLPTPLLLRIFALVCPHTQDNTYETCEQSAIEESCMLCDLRDLAHSGMTCRNWRLAARQLMYHSIRIDAVHYCEREIYLSEARKRKTRFDRNGVPEDTASARLALLSRTLRDDPTRLGVLVEFLKTPYMLRESKTADLARTIAVLPNLKYVDLPEGLFTDDSSYTTLRLEVQARCPKLRKMTYMHGSERSLEALAMGNIWQNLEVLELRRIQIDPALLRHVLVSLHSLKGLKVTESSILDDNAFMFNDRLPAFPPLDELILNDVPRITSNGLAAYLQRREVSIRLKVLSLNKTGVTPQTLSDVLANAAVLQTLSIVEQVDSQFPSLGTPMPPLASFSLQRLSYEITATSSGGPYASLTQGYYDYLAQSLFQGGFPRLKALYVRDLNFPDLLLGLPLPIPGFGGSTAQRPSSSSSMNMFNTGGGGGRKSSLSPVSPVNPHNYPSRFSSNNPFAQPQQQQLGLPNQNANGLGPPGGGLILNQPLEVYTKGEDDLDWGIVKMDPFDNPAFGGSGRSGGWSGSKHGRSGSTASAANRPLSSYGLADVGAGWREGASGARKSVVVGNGAGGFLAVPGEPSEPSRGGNLSPMDEWPRPKSSQGAKADRDLWR